MSAVIDPTEYVIRTRFDLGDGRVAGLGRISRQLGGIDTRISGIGRRIRTGIGSAFLAIAGGVGIGAATRGVIGLHTEVQNAEMGIASLVSAMSGQSMAASVDIARASVRGLRQDAAAGVGELRDYAQGFQQIMGPALQGGADLEQVRKLTRMALTAGFALRGQEGLKLAPMDVVQSLTAGVGERTTPIVNQALRAIGKTNEEFNKLSKPERLRVLEEAFGRFGDAADAMGQTWDAQTATLLDNVKELTRTLTRPLFERWTEQLTNANEWLEKNRDTLNDMATNGGQRLLDVYDEIIRRGPQLGLAGALGTVGLGGARGGGMLAGLLGAGGATAGIAGLAGAAVAGLNTLTFKAGLEAWPQLADELDRSLSDLWESFAQLREVLSPLYRAVMPKVTQLFGIFSGPLVAGVDLFIRATTWFVRAVTILGTALLGFVQAAQIGVLGLQQISQGNVGVGRSLLHASSSLAVSNTAATLKDLTGIFERGVDDPAFAPGTPPGEEDPPFSTTTNNFNGPVTVTVQAERLDDPNTVASSFEAVLRKLMEHPRTGRGSRLKPKPV